MAKLAQRFAVNADPFSLLAKDGERWVRHRDAPARKDLRCFCLHYRRGDPNSIVNVIQHHLGWPRHLRCSIDTWGGCDGWRSCTYLTDWRG